LAFAISGSFQLMAQCLNQYVTPRIVVYGLSKCFSFGILLCFISVISAIFVFIMEYKADKNSPVEVHKDKEEEPGFTCSSLRKFNKLY